MRNNQRSRRDFLKAAGLSAGLSALGVAGISKKSAAQTIATTAPRHHLINLVRKGGWDSLWAHNAVPQSEINGLIETNRAIMSGETFLNPTGNILAPFAPNFNKITNDKWTTRFPDSFITTHPDGQTTLGPGLNFMAASDWANICLWKGIASSGGHSIGNQILQTGGLSGSLPSFSSSIAAQSISNGVFRKLHYVQVSDNSLELNTQGGVYSQTVTPINIANLSSWQALTSPAANQLSTANRRTYLNNAVTALSNVVNGNTSYLASTKDVFTSFLNSYLGGNAILNSNYGTSADFSATVQAYTDFLTTTYNNHVFKTTWFSTAGADNLITNNMISTTAFRFALAEFLVKNDLSTVVDVLVPGAGDFHNNAMNDAIYHLCIYAAYVMLVRRLKSTAADSTSGQNLLDVTTVVMHTEFDRHPLLSCLDQAHSSVPGTDHWGVATSIWLAGKGTNMGKVIGDFKRAPSGARYGTTDYKAFGPYYPLPVDATTGLVSPTGTIPNIVQLCQTMLSIFGALSFSKLNGVTAFAPITKA